MRASIDLPGIRTFADALRQIVWIADAAGYCEYLNAAWYDFTGLTTEQSLGEGWKVALDPADLRLALQMEEHCAASDASCAIEYRLRSASGEYRHHRGAMLPVRDADGSIVKWIGVLDDVDAQESADDRFRTLADALPLLVWTTDRDDRLTFVNRTWLDYTGIPAGSTIEQRNALVHPDDLGRLMHALRGGANGVEFRVRRRSDGAYRWHLLLWERVGLGDDAPFYRIGTAVDVHDQRMAQHEREQMLRTIAEAVPQIVWSVRPDGTQDYVNRAWSQYCGLPEEAAYDERSASIVYEEDRERAVTMWQHCLRTGQPYEIEFRMRRFDGALRWFIVRGSPLRDADGTIVRWFGTCTDIDDQKRYEQEQSYLAELGRIVSSSLDLSATLDHIAQSAVPLLCDACRIDLSSEVRAVTKLIERDPVSGGSTVVVPLIARGEAIGSISFVRNQESQRYQTADVPLLEEVARRSSLAIQNARLYEREHRVADALQSASLPKTLPRIPGIEMDAIYTPGRSDAQIGGDWYDAFVLADGRIIISIGDVAGSGLDAAVTMSNMRQIIRGTALVHADPVLMLNAADRALRLEDPHSFVTAFVGVLAPMTKTMQFASAGHSPPLLRRADGTLEELLFIDLPLGLRERPFRDAAHITLADGDMLVFYTDGLVESSRDMEGGFAALKATLQDDAIVDAPRPAAFISERMLPNGAHDDVAILTVRIGDDSPRTQKMRRWNFDALDSNTLARLRREVREALETCGFDNERIEQAQLVLGELAGNAVRHASGPLEVMLDAWHEPPVLHVIDEGPGFERAPMLPADVMSESGRGLYIVAQLTREFSVARRPLRGSHARAVL